MRLIIGLLGVSVLLQAGSSLAADAPAPAPTATAPAADNLELGARFDCMNNFNIDKGDAQDCLAVTGLRLGIKHDASSTLHARLRIDPFSTPRSSKADTPLRADLPTTQDTALGIIDDYGVTWTPRPNLGVGIEAYNGAAMVPSVSGLGFANSLVDNGWRHTVMTVNYNLSFPAPMQVTFAAGNGEGEPVHNVAPQQFFGFHADVAVIKGLWATFGVSNNGNDVGSEEYTYLWKRYATDCQVTPAGPNAKLGHSMQRFAGGLMLDGTMAGAEGLKVGLGAQYTLATALDKSSRAAPTATELDNDHCLIDPDTVFLQDPTGQTLNKVARTTYDVSLNYHIFRTYFVAADYTTRRLTTGSQNVFSSCHVFNGTTCAPGGEDPTKNNRLSQDAVTIGGGTELSPGLVLSLEYYKASYDATYTQVYYVGPGGAATNTLEIFDARIAYNWK